MPCDRCFLKRVGSALADRQAEAKNLRKTVRQGGPYKLRSVIRLQHIAQPVLHFLNHLCPRFKHTFTKGLLRFFHRVGV